jgi:hypothetical protein
VLIVAAEVAEGRRWSGGSSSSRRRSSRRDQQGATYVWTRHLGEGNNVQEYAYATTERRQVLFHSISDDLVPAGYNRSSIMYDFTGSNSLMFISLRNGRRSSGPCYLVNTDLTYEGVLSTLSSRNNSEVLLGPQVAHNAAIPPLERSEARVYLSGNPPLSRHCRSGKVIQITEPPVESEEATELIKVLSLDSVISLTVTPPERSTRRRGRSRHRTHDHSTVVNGYGRRYRTRN